LDFFNVHKSHLSVIQLFTALLFLVHKVVMRRLQIKRYVEKSDPDVASPCMADLLFILTQFFNPLPMQVIFVSEIPSAMCPLTVG
jgi:hypothetical protein